MPNHYTTKLTIRGSHHDLEAFKAMHINTDSEGRFFDFNSVIPQPDVLNGTESGSRVPKDIEAVRKKAAGGGPDAEINQRSVAAYDATGYLNWYDWAIANWGTKWNSYHLKIPHEVVPIASKPELIIQFDTAWAPPEPVIHKLKEMWPMLTFEAIGHDEFERFWSKVA